MMKNSFDKYAENKIKESDANFERHQKHLENADYILSVYVHDMLVSSKLLLEAAISVEQTETGFLLTSKKAQLLIHQNGLAASVVDPANRSDGGAVPIIGEGGIPYANFEETMNHLVFRMLEKRKMLVTS
jgi:hypothetical protein